MSFILAIDQGTTSTRSIIFDENLKIIGAAQEEFTQHFPQSGWVEHNPKDLLETTIGTCKSVLSSPDIIVEQPRRRTDEEDEGFKFRSESDLRGSLSNDSLSEDEIQQIEEDRAKAEKAAELRNADYQLAYAIDILTGLDALGSKN